MMNAAMERAGQEQRVDPRSWAQQGREDLAALREPKLLAGSEEEARALHAQVDQLREVRAELTNLGMPGPEAAQKVEQAAEREIARVQEREAREISRLDKLIAAARELANEVKERTVAVARNVVERVESLFGKIAKSGRRPSGRSRHGRLTLRSKPSLRSS